MKNTMIPGFKLEEFTLSSGKSYGLPLRYYDWSIMMTLFPAPLEKVQDLIPTEKLKLMEPSPGLTMVILAAMQHRHVEQVESYNEAAILLPVVFEHDMAVPGKVVNFPNVKCFDLYFHHLPVTTKEACDLGAEVWGFPKFVADIDIDDSGETNSCQLSSNGKNIFTLEVKKIKAEAVPINFTCYTIKDDQLIKTFVPTQGEFASSQNSEDIKCVLGDHPIAEELKSIGIGDKAVEYYYASKVQGLLFPPGEKFEL